MADRIASARRAGGGSADSLVVLLHGYGADAADLIPLAEPLARKGTAFAAPDAPWSCAVNPMGRQWFPIPDLDGSSEAEAIDGFFAAVDALQSFLEAELGRHGLGPERVVLAGFSQGSMMALHLGLRQPVAPAGILGFSGRLLAPERLPGEILCRPPVLLVHGDADEMIPASCLHEAVDALGAAEVPVRWRVSPGVGHGIAPDGVELAADCLRIWLA